MFGLVRLPTARSTDNQSALERKTKPQHFAVLRADEVCVEFFLFSDLNYLFLDGFLFCMDQLSLGVFDASRRAWSCLHSVLHAQQSRAYTHRHTLFTRVHGPMQPMTLVWWSEVNFSPFFTVHTSLSLVCERVCAHLFDLFSYCCCCYRWWWWYDWIYFTILFFSTARWLSEVKGQKTWINCSVFCHLSRDQICNETKDDAFEFI